MSGLAEFIEARLAEDEATAKAAEGDQLWRADFGTWAYATAVLPDRPGPLFVAPGTCAVRYLARYDPARALREVAAKRKLLATAEQALYAADHYAYDGIRSALAAVWSDHPDYSAAMAA